MKKQIIKTIGHYGISFFETEDSMNDFAGGLDSPYYMGEIEKLPYKKASKIAEIHPNCIEYFNFAMMSLFKGYTTVK